MIVRGGVGLSVAVLFASGRPDAGVTWRLLNGLGAQIASGITPASPEDVSVNINIAPEHNSLGSSTLFGVRDLEWSYTTGGTIVTGESRYTLEARPPFGASASGVRAKLGVESKDLPDSDISLIRAYISFRDEAGAARLAEIVDEAPLLAVCDAIEAQAALNLLPTMAVRVASSEDSGTNAFKRQAIDWGAVADALSAIVLAGHLAINPAYDATPVGTLFIIARPSTDPITGDAY